MPSSTARVHSLDALRGLLAVGVMLYHVLAWTDTAQVTTLGTYGVYAFFALSGFALEWAYGERLRTDGGLRHYAAARIGRILPLYASAALATAALAVIAGRSVDARDLLLNLTLTFGFFDPGATSTVTGGWSIGIEVVFYLLFPIIVWLRLPTRWLALLALLALVARAAYLTAIWPTGAVLADVWTAYTQVPSFLWFFLAGMVGARLIAARQAASAWAQPAASEQAHQTDHPADPTTRPAPPRAMGIAPFLVALVIVLFVIAASATGGDRDLFAAPLGIALSMAVAVAVVLAGFAPPWHGRVARAAALLGDISYGTYLLHPLVFNTAELVGLSPRWSGVITVVAAPLLAFAVHRVIELPAGRAIRAALAPRRRPDPVARPTLPA